MSEERFLVTGAFGCLGAWVVRELVKQGSPTAVFDLATDPHRLKLVMSDDELTQVAFIQGDITDLTAVERAVQETGTSHIIHLAALQVPFCKANPSLGAQVNVVGTVNVFEAAKRARLSQVVYASSIAVYGLAAEYAQAPLPHHAPHHPRTLYGVYKSANEATARVYFWDAGLHSVSLRPYTVYGPARDQGMTSTPTKAMLAAALGQPYHISFGGRCMYNYTEDVARLFIQAARTPMNGAEAYNIPGSTASMAEVVAAIEAAAPTMRGQFTYDNKPLPFPEEMDSAPILSALGNLPLTPLPEGVAQTIALFKEAVANGRLSPNLH